VVEGSEDAPAGSPAWSPDGRRLALTRAGRIEIHDIDAAAEPRTLLDDPGTPHSLAWSHDGLLVAFVSGNRDFVLSETLLGNVAPAVIRVVPVEGGEAQTVTEPEALSVSPAWLPEGRSLLYVSNRGGVRDIWHQRLTRNGGRSGDPERLTTGLGAHGVSVAADGRRITYSAFSLTSNVWSLALPERGIASVRSAEPVTSGNQAVEDLDVLPGGRWLLFDSNRTGNHDIFLMPLRGGEAFQLTNNAADDFGPAWSPDGLEIAFYSLRNGTRDIFVMSNDGRRVTQVTSGPEQDHQPRWSPDGTRLVFNRSEDPGRRQPWVVTRRSDSTWSDPAPLAEDGDAAMWSPDGRWIAYVDSRSQVHVIPAAGGPSRIVVRTSDLSGAGAPRRPVWLSEDTLLVRQALPGGEGAIWMVPLAGGSPRMVVTFDDPSRTVFRDDFSSDGDRIYFPVSHLESDLWSMELERIRR
jgi:Tol biopolymer transport system component